MTEPKKTRFKSAPPPPASESPEFDIPDVHAIKALAEYRATPDQQALFIAWFNRATGVNQNPYRAGGPEAARDTDVAIGRKFVGDWFYGVVAAKLNQEPGGRR